MKPRKLIALCAVLATLVAGTIPCHAEEPGGSVVTGGGSTTIGGSVDTSGTWNSQTSRQHYLRVWLRSFFLWLYLHNQL